MEVLQSFFKRMFGRWLDDANDLNYYVKIFFAIITALICASQGQIWAGVRGVLFGFLMYIVSLYVLIYIMELDVEALGGRQKFVYNSLPSYLLLWVLLWTVLYVFTLPPEILDNLRPTV
jgi:uncharacterized membrane protein YkgB